eukprot:373987_1
MINLRLFLIYWRFQLSQLKHQQHRHSHDVALHPPQHNIYRHWFVISLFIFTCCIAGFIPFGSYYIREHMYMMLAPSWIINFVITAILISILMITKAKEGIGCMKETVLMLIWNLLMFALEGLRNAGASLYVPARCAQCLSCLLYGTIPLYGALYYIYHLENTLDRKVWKSKRSHTVNVMKDAPDINNADMLAKMDDESMFTFLDSDMKAYTAFREYLTHCWSMESLLFVEKVSVVNQIVLQYKSSCDVVADVDVDRFIRLKFKYHELLYSKYETQISSMESKGARTNTLEHCKEGLDKIYSDLFSEFIQNGAVNEINISYETRLALSFIMSQSDHHEKLQTLDDYLHLFDDALAEIYSLLAALYSFKFKQYIRDGH